MAFDLASALARKEERESARLDEYCFRHRARTFALLAARISDRTDRPVDPKAVAREVAVRPDEAILADLRARLAEPIDEEQWQLLVSRTRAEARRQLVAEFGNPDPHRLA